MEYNTNYDLSTTVDTELTNKIEENVDGENFIVDLTSRTLSYSSMSANTTEEKKTLFNVQNNASKRLKDCINETIALKHVFCEVVNCTNPQTGETITCPRIVLIDDKSNGYACVSIGIFNSLKKLFDVYGEPNQWDRPITIKIKQISKAEKNILTFDVV
jgi:hypothetical protein